MPGKLTDEFTSVALFPLNESAANTLTFEQLQTGLSIYDHLGWVIQRIEWRLGPLTYPLFNGTGDFLTVALTQSGNLASLTENDAAIVAIKRFFRIDWGVAANADIRDTTFVDDYSNLKGGGLLVLPNPLFGAVVGSGLTGAASPIIKIFFHSIQLKDQDYFNLVQARQLLVSQ